MERCNLREEADSRIFWSRQKDAPLEDLNPLTITFASKTTSIGFLVWIKRASCVLLPALFYILRVGQNGRPMIERSYFILKTSFLVGSRLFAITSTLLLAANCQLLTFCGEWAVCGLRLLPAYCPPQTAHCLLRTAYSVDATALGRLSPL